MPLFIGAAAEQLQLAESQLGALAGLLMSGAAISAFLAIFLVRRFNWRKLALFYSVDDACRYCGHVIATAKFSGFPGDGFYDEYWRQYNLFTGIDHTLR